MITPSCPADAKGLLKAAIRDEDPVVFLESEKMYGDKGEVPEGEFIIPIGVADVKRKGTDVTIVSFGKIMKVAFEAADILAKENISAEIIDLRTLNPLDINIIKTSIEKTGKALIVYEDNLTNGPGAEISAIIGEKCFEYLDGPIKRIASKDSPVPFNWFLENKVLPQTEDIALGIKELLEY